MIREDDEDTTDTSQDSFALRLDLATFLRDASAWPVIDVNPHSLLAALHKLSGGQPSRIRLPAGTYGHVVIENTASCLIFGSSSIIGDTSDSLLDTDVGGNNDEWRERSTMAVFQQPVRIDSRAPIAFHGVWFANRVEVSGGGPVFFSQCFFGSSRENSEIGSLSSLSSLPFTSVYLSLDGVCTFSECDFDHICGAAGEVDGSEIPVMTACGRTRLRIFNCSFSGPGVVSSALVLLDSATLEADYLTVVHCSGYGLIVGDKSSAVLIRCIFERNGGGIWVREKGNLEIRDSGLETVRWGKSSLILTGHGRCSAHECVFSGSLHDSNNSGKSIVVARDYSHLSLSACDLFWVKNEELNEELDEKGYKLHKKNFSFSTSQNRDQSDDAAISHVVLKERSEATITHCVLRLPLLEEINNKSTPVIGVILRCVPRVNSLPLYAVENTIVYGCTMEGEIMKRVKSFKKGDPYSMWGLVLPNPSDNSRVKDIQQLMSMWVNSNRFLESDEKPLEDITRVCSSYDAYCRAIGQSPIIAELESLEDAASRRTSASAPGCDPHPHPPSDTLTDIPPPTPAATPTPSSSHPHHRSRSMMNSTMGGTPPRVEETCSRRSDNESRRASVSTLISSSNTSLTTYSEEDEEEEEEEEEEGEEEGEGEVEKKEHVKKRGKAKYDDISPSPKKNIPQSISKDSKLTSHSPDSIIEKSSKLVTSVSPKTHKVNSNEIELMDTQREVIKNQQNSNSDINFLPSSIPLTTVNIETLSSPIVESLKNDKNIKYQSTNIEKKKEYSQNFINANTHRMDHFQNNQEENVECEKIETLQSLKPSTTHNFRKNSKSNNNVPKRKNLSRPITSSFDTQFLSGFSPYSTSTPIIRRGSNSTHGNSQSDRNIDDDLSSTTEVWPWDVTALRQLLRKKLGLYSSLHEYEQAFYTPDKGEEEIMMRIMQITEDELKDKKRVNVEPFLTDIRQRYTATPHHKVRSSPSSLNSLHTPIPRDSYLQREKPGWATRRLYKDFRSKWYKAHLFSELLNELKQDQRRRERLSRNEMEYQATRMHTLGAKGRRNSEEGRVAGSALNYALQQRQHQSIKKKNNNKDNNNNRSLKEKETLESSFVFAQTTCENSTSNSNSNSNIKSDTNKKKKPHETQSKSKHRGTSRQRMPALHSSVSARGNGRRSKTSQGRSGVSSNPTRY